MNPEEVIERLKTIFAFGISNCIADKIARDTTFAALEKQMPKKPITDDNRILCPVCNLLIAYNKSVEQYCWTCGQNLEGCVIK